MIISILLEVELCFNFHLIFFSQILIKNIRGEKSHEKYFMKHYQFTFADQNQRVVGKLPPHDMA